MVVFWGICLFLVFYGELTLLILSGFAFWQADWQFGNFQVGWNQVSLLISNPDTPEAMITVLTTFLGMFTAIFLAVSIIHSRGLRTLVGRGPVVRNFLLAVGILAILLSIGTIFTYGSHELLPNLPFPEWIMWLPVALPLLLLQVSSEELVFRGYLQQELAARFQSRWVWFFLPSLAFGCLHFDPSVFGSNAWLVVVVTGMFGLFAADITARTGNLGAAIGLHFMNNFFAMFVSSLEGTLTGLSLYVTPFTADETDIVRNLLMWEIATVATTYLIYLIVIRLNRGRELLSMAHDSM